jgi:DNA-binding NarL/FixJ family response regulator/lipopolysaccharide biosynthesis regulator YciM
MAMSAAAASLQEGRLAMERGDWQAAREAFEAVLEDGESADAREGLGQALWFLGEVAEGIASRERAFEEHLRAERCSDAARVAVWVSHQHLIAGRASAARGWLARSERALGGIEGCAGRGWVAVEQARHSTSVDEQIGHARRAIEIARETGEDNLEVCALSVLGKAEVTAGHLDEGMRLLEEAMATAAAGRWRNVHTVAEAYCNLIEACAGVGEWDRAHEWCELVDGFAQQYGTAPLLASCRTIHADVLLAAGRWPEAEHALAGALETHSRFIPELGAPTVGTLAELRIRQGRLAEAERLLAGSAEHPAALRALALLRLAEDRPRAAVALLERGLRGTEGNAVRATQLLAPLVDGRLACGDVQGAGVAADDLDGLARSSGIRLIEARARLAAARVELAAGRAAEAAESARQGLAAFGVLAMPFDAGEARLELARAIAGDAPDVACDEARAALAAFRELGASRAMSAAAALLQELSSGAGGRPRVGGDLTAREQEVLELIALGMSNARIARALVISEKTVGHHVSRILMKLGVSNRTEAAMLAPRELGP